MCGVENQDLFKFGDSHICIDCKPEFLQTLKESVEDDHSSLDLLRKFRLLLSLRIAIVIEWASSMFYFIYFIHSFYR